MVFSAVILYSYHNICSAFLNIRSTCRTSYLETGLGISLPSFKFYLMTLLITVTICRAHEKKYFFLLRIAYNYFKITLVLYIIFSVLPCNIL